MSSEIKVIFFDVGGTLRKTQKRKAAEKPQIIQKILDLLGSDQPAEQFLTRLEQRLQNYQRWSDVTLVALDEAELWSQWLLPEWPAEKVGKLAVSFNQIWRDAQGVRTVLPEAKSMFLELFRRGYRLGIISNTLSSTEVPQLLKELGISGYFETVVLSCNLRLRKPDPRMLLAAAAELGIAPEHCAYVGNNPDRDVAAARQAGFQRVSLIHDPAHPLKLAPDDPLKPDDLITNLNELLAIFPGRLKNDPRAYPKPVNASLSSMWAIHNFDRLDDFFEAAQRMGFDQIELNHQVSPQMLEGIELPLGRIRSIHEPCPALISTGELAKRDWLISSADEDCRAQGVASVKCSIDLAEQTRARVVVVHAGTVGLDHTLEKKLQALYLTGQKAAPEFEQLRLEMLTVRNRAVGPRLDAVKRSLGELLDYAQGRGVCLGLENRFHFMDIPSLDEMGELLSQGSAEALGFVLDCGHACALDRMGFYPQAEWLKRYGGRLVGTHLHDVSGLSDHAAPGLGDFNFDEIQPGLAKDAFRTFEIAPRFSFQQIKTGLNYLAEKGFFQDDEN